ncbi:MAG: efflux RND transporter permease subunit [Acidobacteria bacterium]|nr:efflux RND transporter permease subunit [Acidobacteriota bacterium]
MAHGKSEEEIIRDFGDTAALMLTVASPKASLTEIEVRAASIRQAVEQVRSGASPSDAGSRFTIVEYMTGQLPPSALHRDTWEPLVIRDPADTQARIAAIAGDKYSYRELDDLTDLMEKTLKTVPRVSKVERKGLLNEKIYLVYSQERLAGYGISPGQLPDILKARNIILPGGQIDVQGKNITIDPSGEFKNEKEIGDVVVTFSDHGSPVYLRDLPGIIRAYDSPPRYLNFYYGKGTDGRWQRMRAITLSIQMRSGENIGEFGKEVDAALACMKPQLPEDLMMARTSDQPLQVEESVNLFMVSLYEAIILVVLVSLVGFWEWRSAALMALAIPITLAMTERVHRALSYERGVTDVKIRADEALHLGRGVCQDYAHVMIAACRIAGLPARYVSGYLNSPRARESRSAASHAWVDVFLSGTGWVSLDPTHNVRQNANYVRVAIGRDYADVPPTRGIYKGNSREQMDVEVSVETI